MHPGGGSKTDCRGPVGGLVPPITPSRIYSYLVPPAKADARPPDIVGAPVPLQGKLYGALRNVFDRSDSECDTPIAFVPEGNTQTNSVRDALINLTRLPTPVKGRKLATRLAQHTNAKSGMGLLFLMLGSHGADHKVVVSRFPAEAGILAEARGGTLDIQFLEKIFMKRATTYKAAVYHGSSFDAHFWDGAAVDKQIGDRQDQLASYWIHGFLASDFKTTPRAGTRRLAIGLKQAIDQAPSVEAKQEIIAVATLARGQGGQALSVTDLLTRFRLSSEAERCVRDQFPQRTADERFLFERDEFTLHLKLHTVELNTGVSVTGPVENFDRDVKREPVAGDADEVTLITRGKVVRERLKKGRD